MASRRVSKKGFELEGKKAHLLLLHGYTGSPYDLRPMADFFKKRHFHVVVPLLKGHGTKPHDLFFVSYQDWIKETEQIIDSLDETMPIILGGLSMGALLAITLAAYRPNIKVLLLFSPALRLTLSSEMAITSALIGLIDKNSSLKKISGGSDIFDPIAKKTTPAYTEIPIAGLLEFHKLRKVAEGLLPSITSPVFMAFGQYDSAINVRQSRNVILDKIKQPILSKIYDRSKHVITLDYDKERLFVDVWQFLAKHLGA